MGSSQDSQGIVLDQDSELMKAEVQVYNYALSFISSMSLKCAVQLGIPDVIHNHGNKPITLSNLVDNLSLPSTKTEYIHRLMRFLVHIGCFAHVEEGYVLTPLSRLLLKDNNTSKNSMAHYVLCYLGPDMVTPWHSLSTWLQGSTNTSTTNGDLIMQTPFESVHGGMNLWNFMEKNPEFNKMFNESMVCDTRLVMNRVINDPKVAGEMVFGKNLTTLIDVGGGTGAAARFIAEAYPHLKCSVLDLPHVVATSADVPRSNNIVIEFIGGDMFEFIPCADAIFLKSMLKGFNDESCLKLLKRCREAILPSKEKGGKLILVDIVLEDRKEDQEITQAQLLYDMLLMVVTTGKERNEKQWEYLFLKSGFTRYKITSVMGSFKSLIEVYP